jgi:hypothetical protein
MPRARLNGRVAGRDLPLEERKDNGALKAGASESCALDPRDIDPMTAKRKNPGARWEITVDGTRAAIATARRSRSDQPNISKREARCA